MLPQTVEPLREVCRKSIFDVKCFLAVQLDRFMGSRDRVSLPQKGLACQRAVLYVSAFQRKLDFQRVGCEDQRVGGLRYLELCSRARLLRIEHPWLVLSDRVGRLGIGNKMYNGG